MWEDIKTLLSKDRAEQEYKDKLREIQDIDSSVVSKVYLTAKEALYFKFKDVSLMQVGDVSSADESHYIFVNGSLILLMEIIDGDDEYAPTVYLNFHVKCLPTSSIIVYKALEEALSDFCFLVTSSVFYNTSHKLHGSDSVFGKEAIKAYTDDNHKKALKRQSEIDLAAYEAGYYNQEEMN